MGLAGGCMGRRSRPGGSAKAPRIEAPGGGRGQSRPRVFLGVASTLVEDAPGLAEAAQAWVEWSKFPRRSVCRWVDRWAGVGVRLPTVRGSEMGGLHTARIRGGATRVSNSCCNEASGTYLEEKRRAARTKVTHQQMWSVTQKTSCPVSRRPHRASAAGQMGVPGDETPKPV